MHTQYRIFIFLSALFMATQAIAQNAGPDLLHAQWPAYWITVPGEPESGYGVYLFRKTILLDAKPETFIIHVSADNRYKLFVNEKQVSLGPNRGDLEHYNYQTLDIASFLQSGNNIIAAQIWNDAAWRPEGQISLKTGFILQGNGRVEQVINTGSSWSCIRDSSFHPFPVKLSTYYVAGPGELISMPAHIKQWKALSFADSSWKNAREITQGMPGSILGGYGTVADWTLVPSILPAMELKYQRIPVLRNAEAVVIPEGFPLSKAPLRIPSHTQAEILIDQGFLTNAYPELFFSGGKNGSVALAYAESLFTHYPAKGNRNEIAGKFFLGRKDSILSDGSRDQFFTTLAYRTYRYIQIQVRTADDPLLIEDIYGMATGYPFTLNAKLESDQPELHVMLDIGWRTARLCAMETYMDCPYYEQLQYLGDTRIQALVSLYNSGDERLLLNAINDFDHSRRPEGVTYGRHPSYTPQFIPTFSFWYIGMLHDYMMYGRDSSYVKNKLPGERQVMQYFRNYQQPDGSLKNVPHWMFTDWVESRDWASGRGPVGADGTSSLYDFQLLWAYQLAADMESKMGMPAYALLYTKYADQLKKTIRNKYWDDNKKLFADRQEKDLFSQHANTLAILTGMFDSSRLLSTGNKIMTDTSLAPASIYFKFYLHQALVKAGMGNGYLDWLGIWRENIKMGLTTWAEISDLNNARSDCHAWGSSPNIEFFRTVMGIESDAPGFTKVIVTPRLGSLKAIQGEMPHPRGKIKASYTFEKNKWNILIELPPSVSGKLIWKNKSFPLTAGVNHFAL